MDAKTRRRLDSRRRLATTHLTKSANYHRETKHHRNKINHTNNNQSTKPQTKTPPTKTLAHFENVRETISFGRSRHQCNNINELRAYKHRLFDELTELRKQEKQLHEFQRFKHSILQELQHTYTEFLSHLLKFIDINHTYHQQKFVYWTNLRHFRCDAKTIAAEVGDDIAIEVVEKMDRLFGAIQRIVQSLTPDSIKELQNQLHQSIVYQMFVRSRSQFRSVLSKSKIAYVDLLLLQKALQTDMKRDKTIDPIVKSFYDDWLVPHLSEATNKAVKRDNVTNGLNQTHQRLHQSMQKLFVELENTITNVPQLERVHWLLTRQWNFLFVEIDQRLNTSTTNTNIQSTTTLSETHSQTTP